MISLGRFEAGLGLGLGLGLMLKTLKSYVMFLLSHM